MDIARVQAALREPVPPMGPVPASSSLHEAVEAFTYAARRHLLAELRLICSVTQPAPLRLCG